MSYQRRRQPSEITESNQPTDRDSYGCRHFAVKCQRMCHSDSEQVRYLENASLCAEATSNITPD